MKMYLYGFIIFYFAFSNINVSIGGSPLGEEPALVEKKSSSELISRGKELFGRQCASCHGAEGSGDGLGAYLLHPHPRDFSLAKFRLVSTVNHVPSDDDLFKTISRGMPGTSMPPWEHLTRYDRIALVRYVRFLAKEGKIKRLMAKSKKRTREKAAVTADRKLTPGEKIPLPDQIPSTMENIAYGRKLFVAKCASCHGMAGDGESADEMKDDAGFPITARDFTAGVFKGGSQVDDLAYRIIAGIPGTPMPSFSDLTGEELWSLVYYVGSLANSTSQALVEQKRIDLIVAKVDKELKVDMDVNVWKEAKPAYIALLPLWWRKDYTKGVYVQAIHNGQKMAVRMVWEDATKDDNVLDQLSFSDGAAVQFSGSSSPPFFAMGYDDDPVNIWNWKAFRESEAMKYAVVQDVQKNMPDDIYPLSDSVSKKVLYATSQDLNNPVSLAEFKTPVEDLNAGGFGTLTNQGSDAQNVMGHGVWADGFWDVVFVRDMESGFHGDIKFVAGTNISAAFALWDGRFQDRNGQKSVTIWHRFVIGE